MQISFFGLLNILTSSSLHRRWSSAARVVPHSKPKFISKMFSAGRSDSQHLRKITELTFHNRNLENLPVDLNEERRRGPVSNAIFSIVDPTPVSQPSLVSVSSSALTELLGLTPPSNPSEEAICAEYFTGNKIIPGSDWL